MGQLLVQFPGPIRFSLSRPRNRRLHVLDWITLQLFFFLMALTTSYAPGWSSWLPPWIFLFIFFGMIGMLSSLGCSIGCRTASSRGVLPEGFTHAAAWSKPQSARDHATRYSLSSVRAKSVLSVDRCYLTLSQR
jgi:hypothetical protein